MTIQFIKQLGIMMDNPPTCQSQLPRLNPGSYKDHRIQTEQVKTASIRIYSTASVRYKSYPSPMKKGSLSKSSEHIPHHTGSCILPIHHYYTGSFSLSIIPLTDY